MFFSKRPETIESLFRKCSKLHDSFLFTLWMAHHRSHVEFKLRLKEDMQLLSDTILITADENVQKGLLRHLHQQLKFINKNPFTADKVDLMKFYDANYPYQDKIKEIIANPSINEPITPKKNKFCLR